MCVRRSVISAKMVECLELKIGTGKLHIPLWHSRNLSLKHIFPPRTILNGSEILFTSSKFKPDKHPFCSTWTFYLLNGCDTCFFHSPHTDHWDRNIERKLNENEHYSGGSCYLFLPLCYLFSLCTCSHSRIVQFGKRDFIIISIVAVFFYHYSKKEKTKKILNFASNKLKLNER